MIITWYGNQFLKLQLGEMVIGINPVGKQAGKATTKFGSDIALVSAPRPDMNDIEQLSYGEKIPFVISGPGEYEIKGIPIVGIDAGLSADQSVRNTIYAFEFDQIRVCVLGALESTELSGDVIEAIGEVDLLFVPIGGEGVLTPEEAEKISVTLDAKMVIPVHYDGANAKALSTFLKEAGSEDARKEEKLTIKKKDVLDAKGQVAVLTSAL